jgi:acetyl-CoA carboxylase biotin carboxyl carrier protein
MDLEPVQALIDLMRESGVTQLSLELPDFKVSITRGEEGAEVKAVAEANQTEPMEVEGEQMEGEREPIESAGLPVPSPVVGVFHNGGMLDPREVVRVGDRVEEGQVLAAIEAMKVPNELRAPVSGRVTQLLVEDGSAVEYGQTLFVIEPEHAEEAGDGDAPIGAV